MPPPRFPADAILFDLDGTLIDTIPDLADAIDAMLAGLGRPAAGADKVRLWVGNGMENLLRRALHDADGDAPDAALLVDARTRFNAIYAAHYADRSALYPCVTETLAVLQARGIGLGIVTNKPVRFTEPLLDRTGIRDFFGAVVGGDTLPQQKPDPAPLHHALQQLAPAGDGAVLVVGDSVNDIEAARRAGFPIVCLSYGYNHGRDIRDDAPDAVIDRLDELLPLLADGGAR